MKIAISGAGGRMGQAVARIAREMGVDVPVLIERPGYPGGGFVEALTEKVDALIDFSAPEGTRRRLRECVRLGVPMVIGTTGLTPDDEKKLKQAARKIAVLQSTNMSVGVNLFWRVCEQVAAALGIEYDIEIVETHHRMKKDAPSGTALTLAQKVARARGQDPDRVLIYGRKGMVGERRKGEIALHAVRLSDIVGEHTIYFSTPGETLEITHRARTRDIFARGALRAAQFVAKAGPGLYTMADVIG